MAETVYDIGRELLGATAGSPFTALGNPGRPIPLLESLSATRAIWEVLDRQPEEVKMFLSMHQPGTFIVAGNRTEGSCKALFLRTPENNESVGLFPLEEENAAVCVRGSQLYFRNLLELVSFHFVSRDVLPCLLKLPRVFQLHRKADLDAVAAFGSTEFWTMPLKPGSGLASDGTGEGPAEPSRVRLTPTQPACSIRVTLEDAALCVVNPLFLSAHSDIGWLDLASCLGRSNGRRRTSQLPNSSAQQEAPVGLASLGSPEDKEKTEKGDSPPCSASVPPKSLAWNQSEEEGKPWSSAHPPKGIRTLHRVSWAEGISDDALPCWPLEKAHSEPSLLSNPRLLPLIPELDSVSVSSVEDESEGLPPSVSSGQKRLLSPSSSSSSSNFTSKVFHRLSAMSSALTGFLSVERRVSKRVQELAQDPSSYVGGLVQNFVGHLLRGAGTRHPTSTDLLQEIRQMISNLKSYLCEGSDLHMVSWEHGDTEEVELGAMVEGALYKCILKPLQDFIFAQLLDFRTRDGTLTRLREHQAVLREQSLAELGVGAAVPDGACLERIKAKLSLLHQAYSPRKKETQMLKICKELYEAMNLSCDKAEPFGADDFLPVLIYVLVNCDVASVQLDVEYMMELMDPGRLQGEGGYYLTTWFGALYHIENFQAASTLTRQISTEAQHSIHQWQRRRTIYPHHRRNTKNVLYVSFHEPFNNQKAIFVSADMTTASVCAVCAEKYSISDGAAYGLFLVSDGSSQLLTEDSRPQRIRADLLQSQESPVNFVYMPKVGGPPTFVASLPLNPDGSSEAHEPLQRVDVEQLEGV